LPKFSSDADSMSRPTATGSCRHLAQVDDLAFAVPIDREVLGDHRCEMLVGATPPTSASRRVILERGDDLGRRLVQRRPADPEDRPVRRVRGVAGAGLSSSSTAR
jgi:hypothetical protein